MSATQRIEKLTTQVTVAVTRQYVLSLPKAYTEEPTKRWPLVLFLHGRGEWGEHLETVACYGPPKQVAEGRDFPFLLVAPQAPRFSWWASETNIVALAALLEKIEETYRIDPERIYVTGLSMGGYGTWALAQAYPTRFAAIAPICGGGDPTTVSAIRHLPVWAFHGELDSAVPLQEARAMVDALQACGGKVTLTVYPGVEHDSWTQTYDNSDFYSWLLAQRRTITHGL